MVWNATGKFGIHTGRTLRKSSERVSFRDRGFLIKTIANTNINFTDQDVDRCLKKFKIQDGFNDEDIVKESLNHRHWGFGGRGISDDSVLYSIGKRKRWLVPSILKEKIPKDYDSENDYKVVLVERLSVNNSLFYPSLRLKHGDCKAVLDGAELRKPKRRKFAHVGDLRKESNKTEIFYEVNHTEPLTSWPSFLQDDHKWRDQRNRHKARCKDKGKKNKRRTWGQYKKVELNKEERMFDHTGENCIKKENELVLSVDNFEHCSVLHDNNCDFDIGNYIHKLLKIKSPGHKTTDKNVKKHIKVTAHNNEKRAAVNPACSQPVNLQGKGSALYIDQVTPHHGYRDNSTIAGFDPDNANVAAPLTTKRFVPSKAVFLSVDIKSEKLDSHLLYKQFGKTYKEGACLPRRFSICPTNEPYKLVFTCQPHRANEARNDTERVAVTEVSDVLLSKTSQYCKELLYNSFNINMQGSRVEDEPTNDGIPDHSTVSNGKCTDRVAVMSFDLLSDLNRWSYKASLPSLAVTDDLPSNHGDTHSNDEVTQGESKFVIVPDAVMCEICCCEFYHDFSDETKPTEFSCTAMKSCSHWFCNKCWKSYLSAEIQQGKTAIKCPCYDCATPVDDVTIMALLPDRFPKFLNMRQEKAVEMNAAWKWCPGDKCNLVVMATLHKDAKKKNEIVPVPVHCDCGHNWCFACQLEPHWPASCAEAAFFRSKTETYEKIVRANTGGISSVNVKRCPHCSYPIEKNKGCPHMNCAMCKGEFCWTCLGKWDSHRWGDDCTRESKQEEKVELIDAHGSTRFNNNLRVAIANRIARAGPALYTKYSEIRKLEGVLNNKRFESRFQAKKSSDSATYLFLSLYGSHEIPKYLKASADFKFQAHFVIEGVSILMAVSKTKCYHYELKKLISTLLFVVDRLEDMARSRQFCTDNDKMHFERLFNAGKHCMNCIRKLCVKIHQN